MKRYTLRDISEFTHRHRRPLLWSGSTLLALLLIYVIYLLVRPNPDGSSIRSIVDTSVETASSSTPTPTPTPTPSQVPSRLNGVLVNTGEENFRPLAVMIENHPDARPQAGLDEADVVYEAIAEGGITRFMAVYNNAAHAVRVGPVRSARPYYVDYAKELNAMYAHAGGSQDGLAQISIDHLDDLDGLSLGSPLFVRDYSRNVSLEHTLYSNTGKLWEYALSRGWSTAPSYDPWQFQDDAPLPSRPATGQTIAVSVSDSLYDVSWKYDPATNRYVRSMAGKPHIDTDDNQQITAKNVILQTVVRTNDTETYGTIVKAISRYTLTGSGSALVFQNGQSINATWKKTGDGRTRYYNTATGKEITLVRGKIWIQLVESDSRLSY